MTRGAPRAEFCAGRRCKPRVPETGVLVPEQKAVLTPEARRTRKERRGRTCHKCLKAAECYKVSGTPDK